MAEYVGTFPPGSPEWHAARAAGLGGSEIAAVIGLSPWESRFSLWHRKNQLVGPLIESDEMRWGHVIEPAIAEWYAEQHPELEVHEPGTWRHEERAWQIANPDRLTTDGDGRLGVVEIKNSGAGDGWGEPGSGEVPIYYRTQVLWYMDVLGIEAAAIVACIQGGPPVEYVVDYDEGDAVFLREAGRTFLDDLAADVRPDIDAHGETYRVIRELHPDIEDTTVEVPRELGEAYLAAGRGVETAQRFRDYTRVRLADVMGNARRAFHDGEQIAIRVANGTHSPYVKASAKHKRQKGIRAA